MGTLELLLAIAQQALTKEPPAPPPGHPGRAKWRTPFPMRGPIALLLFSIGQTAATMDSEFRIHRGNHKPIEVTHMPYQQLAPQISSLAAEARMEWASTTRADLKNIGDIDREALTKALRGRPTGDQRILKHSISLSSWSNEKLFEAGQSNSKACELCGCPTQTTRHLIYDCPALKDSRVEACKCLPGVNLNDIPNALQIGLPPAMGTDYEATFWGVPWTDCAAPTQAIGCFDTQAATESTTGDTIDRLRWESKHAQANHFVNYHRGNFEFSEFPELPFCNDGPPDMPNVYSDGGVTNPDSPTWATGSFGIFWPDRNLNTHGLTGIESDYAYHHEATDGMELWGNMHSPACSSTRAELMGVIIA